MFFEAFIGSVSDCFITTYFIIIMESIAFY